MKPTFDIAAEMDRLLQSEDNKKAGGYSEQMQKLAFVRVADEDQIGEIEAAMLAATEPKKEDLVQKLASEKCCECNPANKHECKCTCHTENKKEASVKASINKVAVMVDTLLVLSETLEDEGFEKLAAYSIVLADKLVSEAKAKKSKSKSKSKSEKEKASEKAKAKAKSDKEKAKGSKKKTAQVADDVRVVPTAERSRPAPNPFPPPTRMAPNASCMSRATAVFSGMRPA